MNQNNIKQIGNQIHKKELQEVLRLTKHLGF